MFIKRKIADRFEHFKDKLIFVSGPRQAGKTFIIEEKLKPTLELNMDVAKDRINFKRFPESVVKWYESNIGTLPARGQSSKKPLVFVDEIHKVKGWRTIIKGSYDKLHHAINFVASGSSAFKLRTQDKGDSLAGRAVWLNLYPVSFREYVTTFAQEIDLGEPWHGASSLTEQVRRNVRHAKKLRSLWNDYAAFGSFPENLMRKDMVFYRQWLDDYLAAMLDRDLKDLNVGKDVERVYQVFELLLEGLGSTYSLRSLGETLDVSPNTIKSDVRALKQVLWGFELPAAMISKSRQIRKEKKFYPMDFCFTGYRDPIIDGARFECIAACILKRGLHGEISGIAPPYTLCFFKDYAQKEVDFVLQRGRKIILAVECKLKASRGAGNLKSFSRYKPQEAVLLVEEPAVFESIGNNIYAVSIEFFAPCFA